jgi:two-component system chemotaxis response regulator CheY
MSQLKLLIVDDEPAIVELTKRYYEKRDFLTFGATDGVAAVEIFQKERPEINLIDIHMPFSPLDGIEVLKKIREIDKDANCIMATRIHDEESIKRARQLGAKYYIIKPFEAEDLDKCIEEIKQKLIKR